MRIAVIKNPISAAVTFYRSVGVLPFLEKETSGQIQFDYFDIKTLSWTDIFPYDIIFICHPVEPLDFSILNDFKSMGIGKKVWVDFDDYIFDVPEGNRAWAYFQNPNNLEMCKNVLRMADLITVTTEKLHSAYSEFNGNVHVIPNAWNDYDWPFIKPSPPAPVSRIVWRGSNTHGPDLFSIRGVLKEIQEDNAFDLHFFGWDENWAAWMPKLERRRQVRGEINLFQFFHSFFQCGADFLIFPLVDNEFNQSKSNIAWQEATIAGMATIAPLGFPEFDRPGVIRYKDARHLREILAKIKAGKIVKEEHVELSREALRDSYRLSQVNRLRLEAVAGLFGAKVKEDVDERKLKAVK